MPFEPITLELQYKERDLIRLVPFVRRKVAAIQWYILPLIAFLFIIFGLLWTTYRLETMTKDETTFQIFFAPMVFVAIGLICLTLVIRRVAAMVRKMIADNPMLLQPFVLTISETGIENKTKGAEAKYEWSLVKTSYEKLGGIIIVFQNHSFYFIPAHQLSKENYLLVRNVVKEKVGMSEG